MTNVSCTTNMWSAGNKNSQTLTPLSLYDIHYVSHSFKSSTSKRKAWTLWSPGSNSVHPFEWWLQAFKSSANTTNKRQCNHFLLLLKYDSILELYLPGGILNCKSLNELFIFCSSGSIGITNSLAHCPWESDWPIVYAAWMKGNLNFLNHLKAKNPFTLTHLCMLRCRIY